MSERVYPDKLPTPVAILGWDGSDFRVIKVDVDHHTQVDVLTNVLPDDAASETTLAQIQDAIGSRTDPVAGTVNAQLGDLKAGQAPLGRDRTFSSLWDTVVGAGATQAILAETLGSGYVTDVMFRAKSDDNACNASVVQVTLDGTRTSRFILNEMLYLNNGLVLGFADIECFKWDMTGHEFWVHWKVKIPFLTSIKIDVINGDASNVCTMRVGVAYQIDI